MSVEALRFGKGAKHLEPASLVPSCIADPTLPCVTSDNSVGGLWPPEEFGKYFVSTTDYETTKINIKHVGSSKIAYKIINYDKSWVHPDDRDLAKYRSVIIGEKGTTPETSHFQTQLLCFSPPKSVKFEHFISEHPDTNGYMPENICINEKGLSIICCDYCEWEEHELLLKLYMFFLEISITHDRP